VTRDVLAVEGADLPATTRPGPPPRALTGSGKRRGVYEKTLARAEFLRAHRGLWCRLVESPVDDRRKGNDVYVMKTRCRRHPEYAGCEFEARTVDGKRVLFGRYLGAPAASEAA
jgi:hypothetical protein